MEKRKGAARVSEIPKNILLQLNAGEIESANLVEWLAVDPVLLLEHFLMQNKRSDYFKRIKKEAEQLKKQSVLSLHKCIGKQLYLFATEKQDKALLKLLLQATSDSVRSWAGYYNCANAKLTLKQKIEAIKPLADDAHFGVREIAWMALRPHIAENLKEGISLLEKWSYDTSENVRRFASECTRPRGVWCTHIDALKENPSLALSVLSPLKSDTSKYVRDSVGNWLNDASKTQAKWVSDMCKQWTKESKTPETANIVKKALRSIK
jgi:3-methyladenine DNA glycosylase AlkC